MFYTIKGRGNCPVWKCPGGICPRGECPDPVLIPGFKTNSPPDTVPYGSKKGRG